jgi:hypothetical protein
MRIACVLLLTTMWCTAQAAAINQVRLDLEGGRIIVELRVDSVSVPDEALDATKFHVRDAGTGRELRIDTACGRLPNVIKLTLAAGESLDYPLSITVGASGLTFGAASVNLDTTL